MPIFYSSVSAAIVLNCCCTWCTASSTTFLFGTPHLPIHVCIRVIPPAARKDILVCLVCIPYFIIHTVPAVIFVARRVVHAVGAWKLTPTYSRPGRLVLLGRTPTRGTFFSPPPPLEAFVVVRQPSHARGCCCYCFFNF